MYDQLKYLKCVAKTMSHTNVQRVSLTKLAKTIEDTQLIDDGCVRAEYVCISFEQVETTCLSVAHCVIVFIFL